MFFVLVRHCPPISLFTTGHLISNGYRGSSDTLDDDTNPHGGQVICRDGVLYLTVPLEVFAKEEFNPSIDVFEARKPKDECSRLNSYVSSYSRFVRFVIKGCLLGLKLLAIWHVD